MQVKRCGPGDEALWVRVVAEMGFTEASAYTFLAKEDTIALVALNGETICGWCWGYFCLRADEQLMACLYELDVHLDHQRHGVGLALVEAFKQIASEAGVLKTWVVADADNEAANALYRCAGSDSKPSVVHGWHSR